MVPITAAIATQTLKVILSRKVEMNGLMLESRIDFKNQENQLNQLGITLYYADIYKIKN